MKRHGLALILVVGVLAVLAVLGSAFAVLSRLERKAAHQRVLGTQALLLARSGLEDALARLDRGQDPDDPSSRYGGEDWDLQGATLSAFEAPHEVYRPGSVDRDSCPVQHAMRPSFFERMASGEPVTQSVEGRLRGLSGHLSAGSWSLRIHASAGFHVNDADPPRLQRMLGTLAEAIDREDGINDGSPVDQTDGENLITLRPATGWRSFEQMGLSPAKLDALRPYLVLDAWRDPKVIRPNVFFDVSQEFTSWKGLRRGSSPTADPPLPLRSAPSLEARTPVDLSWARRRRPALIALLAGLRGVYLEESMATPEAIGWSQEASLALDWSQPTDDCRTVAGEILSSTSELGSWEQWNGFCDSLPLTGASELGQAKKDLLKANFNPNSDLNKFNPEPTLARLVDKADLLAWSTEFNLTPRGGERISVSGRVPGASRTLSGRRSEDRVLRLTTQADFAAGSISPSAGSGVTFGHKLTGDLGAALQSWPCPRTVPAADWDGQLKLATVETPDGGQKFLARWDDGFDADLGGGSLLGSWGAGTHTPSESTWNRGQLRPDGCYAELGNIPGFQASGNMAAHRGTISFWIKPDYDIFKADLSTFYGRGHVLLNHTRVSAGQTACFILEHAAREDVSHGGRRSLGIFWENDASLGDTQKEQSKTTPEHREWDPHRWHLATFLWDMDQPDASLNTRVLVDRGKDAFPEDRDKNNPYQNPFVAAVADFSTGVFYLGSAGNPPIAGFFVLSWAAGPDSTFDEFAIYDFGAATGTAGDAIDLSETMTEDRFELGRFYKEDDGAWLSAPVDLGPSHLVRLDWTQYVPRGLKAPYVGPKPEDGDPGPDGRVLVDLEGTSIGRGVRAPFRIHALFQPRLDPATKQDKAILDPLVLDDVTLTYRPPDRPAFSKWGED